MSVKTTKTEQLSKSKIDKAYKAIVKAFQNQPLTVAEILIVYGNLGYTLGASIEGYTDKGPSVSELEKSYAVNPTVGVALMLQGLTTCSWTDSLGKTVEDLKDNGKEKDKK